ncbi:MAG: type III-A CRISPR-associated RAMP protein Csm5 [Oscillospiraceae bacterium]|nr:type III-A CRISPR-associated RAMP protein Csm5 [Oscillospiraceae bacterium]
MNSYLRTYRIKLKTLSPVHIGGGVKVGKKEYIYDKARQLVYFPNTVKLIEALKSRSLLAEYEAFILGRQGDLHRFLLENGVEYGGFSGEAISVKGVTDERFNEIHTFIKDAYGEPYIPGSSLKGAFRTVILNDMAYNERNNKSLFSLPRPNNGRYNKFDSLRANKSNEQKLLNVLGRNNNSGNAVNDIMAAFRFSDSEPVSRNALTICRKIDLSIQGNENPISTFRECIKPDVEIKFSLTVDSKLTQKTVLSDLFEIGKGGSSRFMQMLDCFNNDYFNEFERFFEEVAPFYPNMLFIGGGVGFLNKTMLLGMLEKEKRLDFTADFLTKAFRNGHHEADKKLGVSPHMLKTTMYNGNRYEIGQCLLEIEEI